jgi:hypothetical protein
MPACAVTSVNSIGPDGREVFIVGLACIAGSGETAVVAGAVCGCSIGTLAPVEVGDSLADLVSQLDSVKTVNKNTPQITRRGKLFLERVL